jgi:hypothetical protein
MLHEPENEVRRNVCVLLLSPGIKGRVGPHRLYLKLAAGFVSCGYHVLRFDFTGLGDADGDLAEGVLADVYNSIQSGRYVDDARAAMDWCERTNGISQFVASGLCGGSITGLLTAAVDARVRALLGLGIPVAFDGGPEDWQRHLTRGQLGRLRAGYLRRLSDPRAWLRFLSGRSSYGVMWRSLMIGRKAGPNRNDGPAIPDNTNPEFGPAFLSVLRSGRPIFLVFSGADRLEFEFREKFLEGHQRNVENLRSLWGLHTIPNANHVLSQPDWVEEMVSVSMRWLNPLFPPSTIAPPSDPVRLSSAPWSTT